MSDAEWDADDFEPEIPKAGPTDKWEGEDEEDVKDSWEDEDEEKKKEEGEDGQEVKAYQKKKKKPLAERIAEKEAARAAEKAKEEAEQSQKSRQLTAEEKYAEKVRQQKIQEEADLRLAKEAFGVSTTGLDAMFPSTEEEFTQFKDALKDKITSFQGSKQYPTFLENLIQDLIIDLDVESVKKISGNVNSLSHEKVRLQKEADKKKKKKGKAVIRAERDKDFGDLAAAGEDYNDYDDFI